MIAPSSTVSRPEFRSLNGSDRSMSVIIVNPHPQAPNAHRTALLGIMDFQRPTAPARIKIVHLD
jgi:hypothetical protein